VTQFQLALCSPGSLSEVWMFDLLPERDAYRRARTGFYAALQRIDPDRGAGPPRARRVLRCGAGTGMLSVAANGDVYPCQVLHTPEAVAGNLRHQPLAWIWRNSPVLHGFRQRVPQRFDACTDCPIAELCGFNCRALFASFADAPARFTARLCEFAIIDAEERLWREAERRLRQQDDAAPVSPSRTLSEGADIA
jgi:radical SAM protein with 4Fe4S-binding SPASM domain